VTPQSFTTPITELFGIRHPLICGGMMWLSNADYVGAVVNAGGMGFITPRSFPTPEDFRAEVRRCFEITDGKPFGVNLYVSARPEANELLMKFLDISIEEGVGFIETAGYSPREFLPRIKDAGIKVIHKCTTLRHALSAEKAGVDAVIILGAEAGGHPGMQLIGTMVQGAQVPPAMTIPVVLAGGMGTGRQMVACLALGAGGMLLASRMIVSSEIWAHDDYKHRVAEMDAGDTRIIMTIFGDNSRVMANETADRVLALEADGVDDFEAYRGLVAGEIQRQAYETGDWNMGTPSVGQGSSFADRIEPVEVIFDGIMADAVASRHRIEGTK
jgi:NADH:quinone reductase (non-electrogenic)